MQVRPCFLVVDTEHAGSISARKLVLETAKYNVITAYSAQEATATLSRYPNLDGVVLSAFLRGEGVASFTEALKAHPALLIIIVGDHANSAFAHLPHEHVESFAPAKLLELLRTLFPTQAQQLLRRELELEVDERADG